MKLAKAFPLVPLDGQHKAFGGFFIGMLFSPLVNVIYRPVTLSSGSVAGWSKAGQFAIPLVVKSFTGECASTLSSKTKLSTILTNSHSVKLYGAQQLYSCTLPISRRGGLEFTQSIPSMS